MPSPRVVGITEKDSERVNWRTERLILVRVRLRYSSFRL